MEHKPTTQELIEFWMAAAEAEADGAPVSQSERDRLNRLIVEDSDARRTVLALSQQQAWLMWHGSERAGNLDVENVDAVVARVGNLIAIEAEAGEADETARRSRLYGFLSDIASDSAVLFRPPMVFFTLLAATAIGAFFSYGILRQPVASLDPPRMAQPGSLASAITPVAFLTSANGCEWGGKFPNRWQIDREVQMGDELTLHDGIAEFRLSSGVVLIMEGPAAVVLNSPTSLVVQHGRFTARVPWEVTDFRVLASTCRITACDAEFGGDVDGSEVKIHVFRGEAIVSSSPFDAVEPESAALELELGDFIQDESDLPGGSWFSKARVVQGRGVALVSSEGMMKISKWHDAKEMEFVAKLSMAGQLPVSPAYVKAVMNSKPTGYWRFESQRNGRVKDEIAGNDLEVIGDIQFLGDSENRLVELGRPDSDGHFVSIQPVSAMSGKEYSVEVWFKPSHSHRGGLVALVAQPHSLAEPDPESSHAFSLELSGARYSAALKHQGLKNVQRSRIRFLHRDPPGGDYRTGTSCFSADSYLFRRWQQVVAVKQGRKMRLYIDGKLLGMNDDPTLLKRNLYLEVGKIIGTERVLPFVGQMDELSVYDRALSNEEIVQHYRAIRWPPESRAKERKNEA